MPEHFLLQELVLVYGLAVLLLVVAGRLGVPSIVALIGAGIVAGPSGFGLVSTKDDVDFLAEIGVALLLFMAGLDMAVGELRRIWRSVILGGTGQVVLTGGLVAAAVAVLAASPFNRLFTIGLFVALSSTAIVIKELVRRNQIHAPHGRLAVGVLLLQDLIIIAVLVLAPLILGTGAGNENVPLALARLAAVLGSVTLVSRVGLPFLLRVVSRTSREAFSVAVLLASIGTAWITSLLGLSMAVGAFLAGLVLAESEFSHQIHAEVRPLRDLLASLFFISVGMLVDPVAIFGSLPLVLGLAAAIFVVKMAGAGGALFAAGAPVRVAAASALVLAQVGEFSFVWGRSALEAGVLAPDEWQVLLASSVITMMAAPFMVGFAPDFGARVAGWVGASKAVPRERMPELSGHVVILGYGVGGQLFSRALSELATPCLALELNGATVRQGLAAGEPIFYADATAREPLEAAGVERAAAVVAVLSDPDATMRAVRAVREINPTVPLIVRTRYRLEAERLRLAGATMAVAEELEASLEVLAQLLTRLNIPGNVAEVLLDRYRRAASAATLRPMRAPSLPLEALPADIAGTPVGTFRLDEGMWGVGRTLAELDLRAETGATVLALRRGGTTFTSPAASLRLEVGDDLYLVGDDADVRLARVRLSEGRAPTGTNGGAATT